MDKSIHKPAEGQGKRTHEAENVKVTFVDILAHRQWTTGNRPASWLDCMMYALADSSTKTPATFVLDTLTETAETLRLALVAADDRPGLDIDPIIVRAAFRRIVAVERLVDIWIRQEAELARVREGNAAASRRLATMAAFVDGMRLEASGAGDANNREAYELIEEEILLALEQMARAA